MQPRTYQSMSDEEQQDISDRACEEIDQRYPDLRDDDPAEFDEKVDALIQAWEDSAMEMYDESREISREFDREMGW